MRGKEHPARLEWQIARVAGRQHGRVSRRQLLALGLGDRAIEHRLTTGRLTWMRRGVYCVGIAAATQEGRWWTAVLACPPGAVVSHLSAAAVWRLRDADPRVIDISVPARNGKKRDGVRVHRPRALSPADVTTHRGLPVTTVARTSIDIAEMVSTRSLERALDEAEFLGLLTQQEVDAALDRHAGRAGAARLAAVMRRHTPGSTRTRTPLEEDFYLLVRGACLPRPEIAVRVGPYTIDFLWREAGLVVETDGAASHDRHTQRERDGRRDAYLATRGYRTERFTYRQVRDRPAEVLAVLRALLPPSPAARS